MKRLLPLLSFALTVATQAADNPNNETAKFKGARLICTNPSLDITISSLDVSILPNGDSAIVRNTKKQEHPPAVYKGKLDANEFNGTMAASRITIKLNRLSGVMEIEEPNNSTKWVGQCKA